MIKGFKAMDGKKLLVIARITTFSFIILTIIIAFQAEAFGGVIGLLITWFAALLGPISIPMILGLLPIFRRSDSTAAILSIFSGLLAFAYFKIFADVSLSVELAGPLVTSLVVYVGYALIFNKKVEKKVDDLLNSLDND